LLALLGAHHILNVSRIRVNGIGLKFKITCNNLRIRYGGLGYVFLEWRFWNKNKGWGNISVKLIIKDSCTHIQYVENMKFEILGYFADLEIVLVYIGTYLLTYSMLQSPS